MLGSFFADRDLCGVSGNDGLLRFHDAESGPIAQEAVEATFGKLGVRADVFAFDWRARQYAISSSFDADGRYSGGDEPATIVALDPFDMAIEPWGMAVEDFERAVMLPAVQEGLRPEPFARWRAAQGVPPLTLAQCAGATVPGFYGGEVDLGNLELNDVDVYLTFFAQLWQRAREQKPGDPAPRLEV
ncbi:hypothetical protein D1J51_03165 [Leucobacter sp. wl10]|nr:hypothetical protein D1J51_03165 [Leucobacter sp. wl10]